MKLINKISFLHIINTAAIFIIGLFAVYFAVDLTISSQINSQLKDTVKEVVPKIINGTAQDDAPLLEIKLSERNIFSAPGFRDTSFYFQAEQEYIGYREYSEVRQIGGKFYKIITRTSMIEKDDLFWAILSTMGGIMALLLGVLFWVNRRSTKKILHPFYANLKELENFSLHKNIPLELKDSSIYEFKELNKSLDSLSDKALKEYNSLKEFTGDLSHELQTPVAVIKAKLELVLQKEIKDTEMISFIQSAYQNIVRLDKLNRSLILLAKLETKELFEQEKVNLANRLRKTVEDFSEIAQMKEIKLKIDINSMAEPVINENLLDIVLSNLMSNAIKHNYERGEVSVKLEGNKLTIKNTGKELKQKPESNFERFSYDDKEENSLGLGLAITKKICDLYNYKIEYVYIKPYHIISLIVN